MTNKTVVQILQDCLTQFRFGTSLTDDLRALQEVREFLEVKIPELEKEIELSAHYIPPAGLYWVLLLHKDRPPSMGHARVYHMTEKDVPLYKRVEICENRPFKSGEDRYMCGKCFGFGGEDTYSRFVYDHYKDIKWMPITKPTLEELTNYGN